MIKSVRFADDKAVSLSYIVACNETNGQIDRAKKITE